MHSSFPFFCSCETYLINIIYGLSTHCNRRAMSTKLIDVIKINALDEGVVQESHLDPVRDFSVSAVGQFDVPIQSTHNLAQV